MKKILLTALALMLGLCSYAQDNKVPVSSDRVSRSGLYATQNISNGTKDAYPTWSAIHTPFSTTDINGNAVNVADTLAAGKYIVIDYSATWCNPCYRFHQSKNLEAIHNQLGSQVCVLWVEADNSTTLDDIYGTGSNTQGDWTHYTDGSSVSYPIIDCASCESMIDPTGYVPAVYFVTPSGYYCHIYGESWGLTISMTNAEAVANIQALIANSPAAGQAPTVNIAGQATGFVGTSNTYTASIVSVDAITAVNWNVTGGGTITSADNTSATINWTAGGQQTVSLTVTNTTGPTTATFNVNVRDGWNWGDEMSYCENNEYASSIGAGGDITWGVMFPAQNMTGRNYLTDVKLYTAYAGDFTIDIYQGGEFAPQTLLRSVTTTISTTDAYTTVSIPGGVQLDPTKNLWVSVSNTGISYPAAGCAFVGDPNGSLVYYNNEWQPVYDLNSSLQYTWMIKAVTSATAPAFDFELSGATIGRTGDVLEFAITGPNDATYNWTFENGTPATATGMTASASWENGGIYTVTVNGTYNGSALSRSMRVNITDCNNVDLPYESSFEDGLGCWTAIDADGDGYNWTPADQMGFTPTAHTGSGVMCSPSWIGGTVLNTDNWLISPKFKIPAGGATVEWWDWGQDQSDYADHYEVLVSYGGNTTSDFNALIYSGEPTAPKVWTKHSRNIATGSGDAYIAFRHLCSNMFWLFIDDVKVTAGNTSGINEAGIANIDFYPNPVENMLYISEVVNEVSVIDINGRTVMSDKNTRVVNMSSLQNGIYVVRVITDNGIATKKIVKK